MYKLIFFTIIFFVSAGEVYSAGIGPTSGTAVINATMNSNSSEVDYMAAVFYCDIRDVIRGSFGTLIGLLVSMTGLYSYLMSRSKYGFFFFIAGVALTGLPGLFDWYFKGAVEAFGDSQIASRKGYHPSNYEEVETLESWCESTSIAADTNQAAPLSSQKDVDVNAVKGIGLNSLSGNTVDYYTYKVFDNSGTVIHYGNLK